MLNEKEILANESQDLTAGFCQDYGIGLLKSAATGAIYTAVTSFSAISSFISANLLLSVMVGGGVNGIDNLPNLRTLKFFIFTTFLGADAMVFKYGFEVFAYSVEEANENADKLYCQALEPSSLTEAATIGGAIGTLYLAGYSYVNDHYTQRNYAELLPQNIDAEIEMV